MKEIKKLTIEDLSTDALEFLLPLQIGREEKRKRSCDYCPMGDIKENVWYEQVIYRYHGSYNNSGQYNRIYEIFYRKNGSNDITCRLYNTARHYSLREALIEMYAILMREGILGVESMTKQEAKALTLEVWQYLADHPEIRNKENLPSELYEKIEGLLWHCPLCELYKSVLDCFECPLDEAGHNCIRKNHSAFENWCNSSYWYNPIGATIRKLAAKKIVKIVRKWVV